MAMERSMGIDHITLCVKNLQAAEYLFTKILGFEVIWSARDVGTDMSSMDTIVVQRGETKVALMQGRDKAVKSQITEFIEKYGEGVQHVAVEVGEHRVGEVRAGRVAGGHRVAVARVERGVEALDRAHRAEHVTP
jgi:4-hydroxyphenylpyruvate dioxygenase-like putative hemolysin